MSKLGAALVVTAVAVLVGLRLGAFSSTTRVAVAAKEPTVEQVLSGWPDRPHEIARALINKYGPPQEFTSERVIWTSCAPWKRTVVLREQAPHNFPRPHTDFVEQTIHYRVPVERVRDLSAYDGSLLLDRTRGELTARSDGEEPNWLAINVANDLVAGRRTVDDARRFVSEDIQALGRGEKRPYTQRFVFPLPSEPTGDPDIAVLRVGMAAPAPLAPLVRHTR